MRPNLILALTLATLAVPGATQDSRPSSIDVKAVLDELQAALKKRDKSQDLQATGLLQQLGNAYEDLEKKDRKKVLRAIDRVFTGSPLRDPESGLYQAAAEALGKMGDDGVKPLQRAYDSNRFPTKPEWVPLHALLIEETGNTKSLKAVKFLTQRVGRASSDEEVAAAGRTLENYADADQRVRKEIVKEMVKKLGGLESTASQPRVNDPSQSEYFSAETARRTLRAVQRPFQKTLSKLTGQRLQNGTEWQRWYNKNKSRNWDTPARRTR